MDWSLKSQVGSPQEWRTVQQGDPANNETVPHGKKAHLQEITPKDNEGKHCRVISGQITIIPKVLLISYQTWNICIGNFGTLPHNNLHCSLRLGGGKGAHPRILNMVWLKFFFLAVCVFFFRPNDHSIYDNKQVKLILCRWSMLPP